MAQVGLLVEFCRSLLVCYTECLPTRRWIGMSSDNIAVDVNSGLTKLEDIGYQMFSCMMSVQSPS